MAYLTDADEIEKKNFWFCGICPGEGGGEYYAAANLVTLLCCYYIWETKLKKKRPVFINMMWSLNYSMEIASRLSRKVRLSCKKINLPLFRQWTGQEQYDGEEEEEEGEEEE
jgi:hypothetical protein